MQNGSYPWVSPTSIGQKTWPGYQASLTDLFLKKNPLHFGTGISQLAAASNYIEKMSSNFNDQPPKCPHPDSKDKPYPCEICKQYFSLCNNLKQETNSTGSTSSSCSSNNGSVCRPSSIPPSERKLPSVPNNGLDRPQQPPPPHLQHQQMQQHPGMPPQPQQHHAPTAIRTPVSKRFFCPVCHKSFSQKGNLKTHMMIHTGEKPYACQICGKSFTQKGNVDTHMKIHTGEKSHSCDSCGKRFTQRGNLKTHIRSVHTKEKPFACGVCGKSFSQKGNMQTHMRTHNKDDRFPCTLCGKTFSQKGNLKTHMQRHTGQLPSRRSQGSRNGRLGSVSGRSILSPAFPSSVNSQATSGSPQNSPTPPQSAKSLQSPTSPLMGSPLLGKEMADVTGHCKAISSPLPPFSHTQPHHLLKMPQGIHPSHLPGSPISEPMSPRPVGHLPPRSSPQSHATNLVRESINNHQQLIGASGLGYQHLRINSPPLNSNADDIRSLPPDSRPFYSAPPTPLPTPLSHSPSWLAHSQSRHYDAFQPGGPLSSYASMTQNSSLARLSLLTGHASSQHAIRIPSSEDKMHHEAHGGQLSDSHFQTGNPDFSQLLE